MVSPDRGLAVILGPMYVRLAVAAGAHAALQHSCDVHRTITFAAISAEAKSGQSE